MNCAAPYVKDGNAYGCGQCIPCRVNKRREWTHRIMLEASQYGDNAFLTLTYDDKHLPRDGSLNRKDLQNFLKRFRKSIEPLRVRYYGVGEYGDQSKRPHYHLAMFGYPTCSYMRTRGLYMPDCCTVCGHVYRVWGKGNVYLGTLEPGSAGYIAGYVTKKLTKAGDARLEGKRPEFGCMSLRPGIGAGMMHELASTLLEFNLEKSLVDVPMVLQHGMRKLPLGRYLRRELRKLIGRDKMVPEDALEAVKKKMQLVREMAWDNSTSFRDAVTAASLGRRIQIEAKAKREKKVGRL